MKKRLERINFLADKEKKQGLTNAEKVEQQVLREDHLREIKGQVTQTISSIRMHDDEGNDVTPDRLMVLKRNVYGVE